MLEGDFEYKFPTQYAQNTMSYMTISNSFSEKPVYDSKIYNFYEKDIDKVKTFVQNNPNLRCLISIEYKDRVSKFITTES